MPTSSPTHSPGTSQSTRGTATKQLVRVAHCWCKFRISPAAAAAAMIPPPTANSKNFADESISVGYQNCFVHLAIDLFKQGPQTVDKSLLCRLTSPGNKSQYWTVRSYGSIAIAADKLNSAYEVSSSVYNIVNSRKLRTYSFELTSCPACRIQIKWTLNSISWPITS